MMSLSRSMLPFVGILAAFLTLSACGDDDESIGAASEKPVAKTKAELPECSKSREGEVYPVEEDDVSFKCEGGTWLYDYRSDKRRDRGSEYDPATGTLTDLRDNRTYRTVKIGDKIWTAENLKFRAYERTDVTPCFNYKEENCDKYGRLYAIHNSTVCPKGWHMPDTSEFRALLDTAATLQSPAINALKATEGWGELNGESLNGTDDLGFSLLPGGYMCRSSGFFERDVTTELGTNGFWGFSMNGDGYYYMVRFRYGQMDINYQSSDCYVYVRCIMD